MTDTLEAWFARWGLEPDGAAFAGSEGRLAPVRFKRRPAMLKVFGSADEARGGRVLDWWGGRGAVEVLASAPEAVLMVRAPAAAGLAQMAEAGEDDQASAILCHVVAALHAPRPCPEPAGVPPLRGLFAKLVGVAQDDARLAAAAATAARLLETQQEVVVLHADIHHFNVLDFGGGDWRAIDPWGYRGERAYDYANIVRNPSLDLVRAPGRLERQLEIIAAAARLELSRLRSWVFAHAGLAAVWDLEDGHDPSRSFAVLDRLAGA